MTMLMSGLYNEPAGTCLPSVLELHAWRSPETCTFATFIYEKGSERLLRHIIGTDETEVIHQALVWREKSS
jgi:hypothetical protein